MMNIHSRRICFFDNDFLNMSRTTATILLHHPVFKEIVMTCDAPWEGDGCDYGNLFFDKDWHGCDNASPNGVYRFYYLGWHMLNEDGNEHIVTGIQACYAESPDGINWTKPNLGIYPILDSTDNNIVFSESAHPSHIDNFMVFKDGNPSCPPEERYKAVGSLQFRKLGYWTSPDGLHFSNMHEFPFEGTFDSLNVTFWDERLAKYRCYFRGFHPLPGETSDFSRDVRDIRFTESEDFITWSEPKMLEFDDGEDIPLYTNNVEPYFRAPDIYIGTPTRYIERKEWTANYDELGGREKRLKRMNSSKRYGLAVTDCAFVVSHDGHHFHRFPEAYMRPLPETGKNWVYGDCYPSRGYCVTPSAISGAPDELSTYLFCNHWMSEPALLQRYTLRMDGFASLHADGKELMAVTRQFAYDGSELHINFETSARGYIFVTLVTEDGTRIESCETFGNAIDRKVAFNAPLPPAGTNVTMELRMMDADIYSLQFK